MNKSHTQHLNHFVGCRSLPPGTDRQNCSLAARATAPALMFGQQAVSLQVLLSVHSPGSCFYILLQLSCEHMCQFVLA